MSVEDFKKGMGVPEIEVKKNPHTGKCFFVCGNEVGAVSSRFEKGGIDIPVISQVCSADTGELFFLLHQRGEGGLCDTCKILILHRLIFGKSGCLSVWLFLY